MDETRAIADILLLHFLKTRVFIYAVAAILVLLALTALLHLPGAGLLLRIALFSPYLLTCAYMVQFVNSDMPGCIRTHVLPRCVTRSDALLGVAAGLAAVPAAVVWTVVFVCGALDVVQTRGAGGLLQAGTAGITMTADLAMLVALLLLPSISGQMWLGLVAAGIPLAGEVMAWMCKGNPLIPRYGFLYFFSAEDAESFWRQFASAGSWWRPLCNLGVAWLLYCVLRRLYEGTDVA